MIVSASALHGSHDPRTIRAWRLLEELREREVEQQLLTLWAGENRPPSVAGARTFAVRAPDPFAEPEGRTRRYAQRLRRRLDGDPSGLLSWARRAARELAALPADERPEVLYAIGYPVGALIAGSVVAAALEVPWIADLGDPWDPSGLLERRRRNRVLSSAAALVTTNAELARSLTPTLRSETPVLLSPAGGTIRRRAGAGGLPLVVHLGSINAGRVDPRPAFEVLSAAHARLEIEFRSHTNGWHPELDSLPHPHLEMLAADDALELSARAAAVLVLGNQSTIQIPSKAYEIACTESWALCVSELDEDPIVEVLSAGGHAVAATNDIASIGDALSSILEREQRGQKPAPVAEHDWARRVDAIEELIGSVLANRSPR